MGNISGKREILKNEYYFSSIDFENSDDFFAEILRSKLNFLMLATFGCSSSLSNRSPQFDVIILNTRFTSFSRLSSFHFICIATQFWFVSKKEEADGKPCDIFDHCCLTWMAWASGTPCSHGFLNHFFKFSRNDVTGRFCLGAFLCRGVLTARGSFLEKKRNSTAEVKTHHHCRLWNTCADEGEGIGPRLLLLLCCDGSASRAAGPRGSRASRRRAHSDSAAALPPLRTRMNNNEW